MLDGAVHLFTFTDQTHVEIRFVGSLEGGEYVESVELENGDEAAVKLTYTHPRLGADPLVFESGRPARAASIRAQLREWALAPPSR